MAAADLLGAVEPPAVSARRRFSARFLRSELGMVFRRRRNAAILVVLGCVPVLIAIAVRLNEHNGNGGAGGLFGNITDNGVFVAFAALLAVLPLFLPMAVAVVAGDAVSGEANIGTLRYLLAVPVGRTRLLAVKFVGIFGYAVAAALTVAIWGAIAGLALFPAGNVTLLSGTTVSLPDSLWRLLLVVGYCAAMMMVVAAIGLFISTLTEVPVAAMAATLALTITSEVLDAVPQLSAIHAWLPSHYWLRFADLLRDPIPVGNIAQGLEVCAGYVAVFLALAWARFSGKDVTS
jgi:ABC-2 type transport system permease protein